MGSMERLGHLKFMQRAKLREEEKKKKKQAVAAEDAAANENEWTVLKSPGNKCVVIVEGDPLPGAPTGRMSFQGSSSSAETTPTLGPQKVIGDYENSRKHTATS